MKLISFFEPRLPCNAWTKCYSEFQQLVRGKGETNEPIFECVSIVMERVEPAWSSITRSIHVKLGTPAHR